MWGEEEYEAHMSLEEKAARDAFQKYLDKQDNKTEYSAAPKYPDEQDNKTEYSAAPKYPDEQDPKAVSDYEKSILEFFTKRDKAQLDKIKAKVDDITIESVKLLLKHVDELENVKNYLSK